MLTQPTLNLQSALKIFLLLNSVSIFFFISPAKAASIPTFYDVQAPANSVACSCSDTPSECANSENLNNCGLAKCDGGNAWTKYRRTSCLKDADDPNAVCGAYYNKFDVVYSIGDKCISGGPYLNPGYCESAFGGPIYKTCCSNTGNELSPFQCVAFDADGAGDPEGRCPAGYTREVFCGAGTGVECGQAACGPVGSPKTCDYNRSYNQCCGNNLSQNVDEYTWSDGTGVCNHIVGECNQTDPACAGATPPPAATPTPTPSPAPPTDTQAPTCNSFTLNNQASASVRQGDAVTIGTTITDNVWVQNVQFFRDSGSNLIQSFNPISNPFSTSYSYDSSPLSPGTYTIIANAQDSSGNSMFGNDVGCRGTLTITAPETPIVSCSASPNPVSSGATVTFTATPGGGSGVYSSYTWAGDAAGLGTNSQVSTSYNNPGPGSMTKTARVTVTDNAGQTSPENSCTVTINPPGALIVTPSAQCVSGSTTEQTISASWNLLPSANSYAPDLKATGGSIGGINCTTSTSFPFTINSPYSTSGSYTVYVNAYSGPNCSGSIVASANRDVTNASCSSTPTPTPTPAPTGTCDPAIESRVSGCTSSVNPGCQLVGGIPTVWCINNVGSGRVCQYCPPPPPPPSCNVFAPPNDSPTVTLRPDGHTLDIIYRYAAGGGEGSGGEPEGVSTYRAPDSFLQKIWQKILKVIGIKEAFGASSVPEIRGLIYRSNQRGFVQSSGTEIGTQFGLFGISFDPRAPISDQRQIEYYQVNALSGANSAPSNTSGVVIGLRNNQSCSSGGTIFGFLLPSLISASQVSSTDTRVTFNLVYDWLIQGAFMGPRVNPAYLKINRSSASTPAYIPWDSSTKVEKVCAPNSATSSFPFCSKERYTVTYVVDLPPGTSDNLTITGYNGTGCPDANNIGTTAPFAAQTQSGTNPNPISANLSASSASDANGYPMVTMGWTQTLAGEIVKVKRSNDRWSGTSISPSSHGTYADGIWTFKTTDDLASLPRGQTYYYGAELDLFSLVGTGCNNNQRIVKSEQTPFFWDYSPWVKTINGDVHSQTGINTPGGP